MAKRVRGSVRPGQRRPTQRRPAAPAKPAGAAPAPGASSATPRPSGLTEAETARAAELEAQLLAEERAAEAALKRTRAATGTSREYVPAGGLALREEETYAYVGRDVKDIVRVGGLLIGILLLLWVLIDVAEVLPIG